MEKATILVAALAVAAVVGSALVPSAVSSEPGNGFRASLERELAAHGKTLADLPDPVQVTTIAIDGGSGTTSTATMPLGDFIDEVAHAVSGSELSGTTFKAKAVGGQIVAQCSDGLGICFNLTSHVVDDSGHDLDLVYNATHPALDSTPARPFWLAGGQNYVVSGHYHSGSHFIPNAAAGQGLAVTDDPNQLGANYADRAIKMEGAGSFIVRFMSWAPGLYISTGTIRAHGEFQFCAVQTDTDCAP
ncbi:MAG: hypothetical protein ACYDCK_04200 [Thermoplasmatota archaeon]